MANISDEVLIYDIETKTESGLPDSSKDTLRIFACYSYKFNRTYLVTKREDIQRLIDNHKYLVGFNNQGLGPNEGYDNPVLKRFGIKFDYKIIIDLRNIFKQRASQMKVEAGMLGDIIMSYSLKEISTIIGIVDKDSGKKELDYTILNKATWTSEEVKQIKEYTERDIEVTKKMYEWVEDYFASFKDFINDEDIRKKVYLTGTLAKLVYKIVCKAMNWKEEYGDKGEISGDDDIIKGGYVAAPAGERFDGHIYIFDYSSLYPHLMMMCNLHNRKKLGEDNSRPVWSGGGNWKVEGEYYSDEMGGVAKLIKKWYGDRIQYKKQRDRREYTLKITMNTIYGVTDDPYYSLVYDKVAAGDCTRLGRQFVMYARKRFREAGYKVIYTDTDSIFVLDTFNDEKKILDLKEDITTVIKTTVPFPLDTFNLALETEAKHIFFFRGGKDAS